MRKSHECIYEYSPESKTTPRNEHFLPELVLLFSVLNAVVNASEYRAGLLRILGTDVAIINSLSFCKYDEQTGSTLLLPDSSLYCWTFSPNRMA